MTTCTIPVSTLTREAENDNLTPADYRDIYDELRGHHTLRAFVEITASRYSFAWWGKYERGEIKLTRDARNELRAAVGIPQLPPTIEQASADINPNAIVYRVGSERPTRVILVGHPRPLTLHLNGQLTASEENAELPSHSLVTAVTRARKRQSISLHKELWGRLNAARAEAGLSWEDFLTELLHNPQR